MKTTPPVLSAEYQQAKVIAEKIAADQGLPRFYSENQEKIDQSEKLFTSAPMVRACMQIIADQGDAWGHGFSHVRKVSVDVGALMLLEGQSVAAEKEMPRLVLLAHLAGLLHDIKRREKNHALRGAEEARHILAHFPVDEREAFAITQAIRNHEAFQPHEPLADPAAQLLSNALYDADKFRWGPDNFTETLWAMVAPRNVPIEVILAHFIPGMEGVRKIRDTFRTLTGQLYGPDFIDRGLAIGQKLYEELTIAYEGRNG